MIYLTPFSSFPIQNGLRFFLELHEHNQKKNSFFFTFILLTIFQFFFKIFLVRMFESICQSKSDLA